MLVLVKESRKSLFISDLGLKEYDLGIRLHMPLAHAKAIEPSIAYYLHDEKEFNKAFLQLAYSAMRFSPNVAIDNYGLLIDISGCSHLFGGETSLLLAIDDFFSAKGFYTKRSIAPNPLLAKATAYFAPGTIIEGKINHCLKSLPIDALFLNHLDKNALADLGITTLENLLLLPKKMLAIRFGFELLQRLDQIQGIVSQPINYLKEQHNFVFQEQFLSPIRTHEYLLKATHNLLVTAIEQLSKHYLALQQYALSLTDIFKKTVSLTIESSQAHNQVDTWQELLSLKIENLNINQGIDHLKIKVINFSPITSRQGNFSQTNDSQSSDLSLIADKLRSRLGEHAIFHSRIIDSHNPEQAMVEDFSLAKKHTSQLEVLTKFLPPRPLRLFKKPIPISVIALLPDSPPAKIMWKHRAINILNANGPERIEPEWWSSQDNLFRDYFYVEDERGKRLWIYSMGEPKRWFIHGIFA